LSRNRKDEREINKTQRRGGGSDTQQLERELGADIRAVMGGRAVVPPVRSSYEESGGRVPPRHGAEEPMRGQENRRGVPEAPDDPEAVRAARKKRRKRNSVYYAVTYFFVLIFLALIGYMVYFNLRLRDDVMRSPYNKRQDAQAKYTTRGRIETIDGTVVAKTERDGEGKDYRVYPEGRVYAHVVGFDTHGKSGIENIANYELLTSNESIVQQVLHDFSGQKNNGDTVISTIRADLQRSAYRNLGEYQGAVVAFDPDTGAVYALVSKPDFDPNTIASDWNEIISEENSSVLVNRATQGRYAPGSTFKVITALAYLRKYGATSAFSYECTGEIEVDGRTIHCSNGAVHGTQTLEEAFTNSCNCAFAYMGKEVGALQLRRTAESLLFNTSLPAASLSSNGSSFSLTADAEDFLIMQTSFGQGKTLTSPMHMALIAGTVAGGGVMMQPYLIDHVENADGLEVSRTSPKSYKRLMSAQEAAFLKELMRKVVTEGTASALADRSYTAYGKTGSAEYGKSDGSIGTHSWFMGYAEKDGKKLAVAVLAEGAGSGSGTAVPIARELFDTYFE